MTEDTINLIAFWSCILGGAFLGIVAGLIAGGYFGRLIRKRYCLFCEQLFSGPRFAYLIWKAAFFSWAKLQSGALGFVFTAKLPCTCPRCGGIMRMAYIDVLKWKLGGLLLGLMLAIGLFKGFDWHPNAGPALAGLVTFTILFVVHISIALFGYIFLPLQKKEDGLPPFIPGL